MVNAVSPSIIPVFIPMLAPQECLFSFKCYPPPNNACSHSNVNPSRMPVLILGTGYGSQGSNPQSYSARPLMVDMRSPLDRGCHIIIRKAYSWTILWNV